MKEIIYLDVEMMNSMLAQLDEGLINSFALESSEQENVAKVATSSASKNPEINGGIKLSTGFLPGGSLQFGSKLGASNIESESVSNTMLEGQKDILNKAFHDYALDLLINKLQENQLIIDNHNLEEGDISFLENQYRFYDFDLIKNSTTVELMEKIILAEVADISLTYTQAKKIIDKDKPTAKDREQMEDAIKLVYAHDSLKPIKSTIEIINTISLYSTNLLKDLTLIKSDNYIGLLKKDCLRESTESLSFRTNNSRSAKFLFRVIGKKECIHNGHNTPLFSPNDVDKIPGMMLDIILGQFDILEKGDILISPVAIYY